MVVNNINIQDLINHLQKLKDKGYSYLDLEISDKVSNPKKFSKKLEFYPLEPIQKKITKPITKLGIEELIKFHT